MCEFPLGILISQVPSSISWHKNCSRLKLSHIASERENMLQQVAEAETASSTFISQTRKSSKYE